MRIDLETIKKIEYYLTNNMSVVERKLFEQEITNNHELREAVQEQKNLTMAMEKSTIKSLAVNAGIKYRRNQFIKYVATACVVVVMVIGSYLVYDMFTKTASVNQEVLVENVVPHVDSSQPNINETVQTDSLSTNQSNTKVKDGYTVYSTKKIKNNKEFFNNQQMAKTNHVVDSNSVKLIGLSDEKRLNVENQLNEHVSKKDSFINDIKLLVDNDQIFHHFTKESEFFTVSAKKDIQIKGWEGTRITIPQGTLVDSTGKVVTGSVKIQLMEFYNKSDVILANLHTQSDDQLLESAGTIYIAITQDGEELYVAPDKSISIQFNGKEKNDSMLLFNGIANKDKLDWKLNDMYKTIIDSSYYTGKTMKSKGGAIFHWSKKVNKKNAKKHGKLRIRYYNPGFNNLILQTNQLGWINCDRFISSNNNTSLTVKYNTGFAPVIRLVFTSMNSLMSSNNYDDTQTLFSNVPIGKEVDVVAFSMVNNEPYYFLQKITIAKDQVLFIDLKKTTLDDLEKSIKALNRPRRSHDFKLLN